MNNKIWLEKLKGGTMLLLQKQQTKDIGYEAIGYNSELMAKWSRVNEYAFDIERIKREMDLAVSFIKNLPEESYYKTHNTTTEDFILYHQGHFLELVHQMKDKLLRIIDRLEADPKEKEPDKIRIAKVISKSKIKRLNEILSPWDQISESEITKALNTRTLYHHFGNTLPLTEAFQNVKLHRLMQKEEMQKWLSEIGKAIITERGTESLKKWHGDVLRKITTVNELATESLGQIAKILCKHFGLPSIPGKGNKIVLKYFKVLENLNIKNVASKEKINRRYSPIIDTTKGLFKTILGDGLISFYLTGSVARGEAIAEISDVNMVVVIKDGFRKLIPLLSRSMILVEKNIGVGIDIKIFTESDFKHIKNFKIRFICKTDGVLLEGMDLIESEKFPKPGLGLAYLLNKDLEQKVQNYKQALTEKNFEQTEVNKMVKESSRGIFRLIFAEVMANKAVYAKTFDEMRKYIMHAHPENWKIIRRVYIFATSSAYTNQEGLANLLSAAEETFIPLLKQLEVNSKAWYERWLKKGTV